MQKIRDFGMFNAKMDIILCPFYQDQKKWVIQTAEKLGFLRKEHTQDTLG